MFQGRVRLLNEIGSLIASDDPSVAPIYVLDGVAGIGKSTIAKTLAERAADINGLQPFLFERRRQAEDSQDIFPDYSS